MLDIGSMNHRKLNVASRLAKRIANGNGNDGRRKPMNAPQLQPRGIDAGTIRVGPPPIPEEEPAFFAVSPLKLAVMAIATFGLYEVYWFYKNWKIIKGRAKSSIMPFWRAIFGVIWCYPCFREIGNVAESRGLSLPSSPGLLAVAWIILTLMWRLPDPYWLICFLTPIILIPIQNTINRLNTLVAPNHNPNSRFTVWNIVGVVVGGTLFVFAIIGAFSQQQ